MQALLGSWAHRLQCTICAIYTAAPFFSFISLSARPICSRLIFCFLSTQNSFLSSRALAFLQDFPLHG